MTGLIRKGNPIGKTDLTAQIVNGLIRSAPMDKKSIHGSDAAFCSRKSSLHLGLNNHDKVDLDPSSTLYFAVGNAIHDAVRDALKKAGVLVGNEVRLEFGLIRGFIDDVIISAETGKYKIIDVKTCGKLPAKIKADHESQLLCYALLTGIEEASVVYISRSVADYNGVMIKELKAPVSMQSMRRIARVVAESIVCTSHKVVPQKPEYRVTRDGCGWCPFKDNGCYSESGGILPLAEGWSYGNTDDFELEIAETAKDLLAHKNSFYVGFLTKIGRPA